MRIRAFARLFTAGFVLIATLATASPALAGIPPVDSQGQPVPSLAPMLKRVMPAVVNVYTRKRVPVRENPLFADPLFRQFFNLPPHAQQPRERFARSLGSGVIIDAKHGYILTNNHVVANADQISVTLHDGRSFPAKLVGADKASDIAVIQIKAKDLTSLPVGNSDNLRVGDFVVAIGDPFGIGQTATSGIVSALGRTGLGIEGYEDFIQTDASINPGNSGGALVNLRGHLVGINTAILSKSGGNVGIGFAIPVNMAREVMNQLIKYGHVRRGQLGVMAQNLTPNLAAAFGLKQGHGAVVSRVLRDSPAAKAGVETGDIVVAVNGHNVRDAADLRNTIGLLRVGQTVKLGLLRRGKPVSVDVRIEAPRNGIVHGEEVNRALAGATLTNNRDEQGNAAGVTVAKVAPGSPAWDAGLRNGDIISEANHQPVSDIATLRAAAKGSPALLLNVQRGNGALYIYIR